jgi:hypothetical protein
MNKWIIASIATGTLFNFNLVFASDQIGTLTQVEGIVKVFSHPTSALKKEEGKTHALFEGEFFSVEEAKVGTKVDKGYIVQTAPGAKARVVYENGDQFNVGSGTAYKVTWDKEGPQGNTQVNLAYGKIRGIIEKGGPRSKLQVRTRSAVMGVRGTDFFIAQGGGDESTEISVIRGSVEVTAQPKESATASKESKSKSVASAPITLKAGYSAAIEAAESSKVKPQVELRKTTQEEFAGIQKSSTIAKAALDKAPDAETQKNVDQLEKKATATILKDIKAHDHDLYAVLEKQGNKNPTIEELNHASMQVLIKDAPKAPTKRKPYKSEIESIENGAYDKYFKIVD